MKKSLALLAVGLIALVTASSLVTISYFTADKPTQKTSNDFFFGIDLAYGNFSDYKELIDQTSAYTNLLVVGSRAVTTKEPVETQVFQYAYDKGLSFISLKPGAASYYVNGSKDWWFQYAQKQWGNHLLGFYEGDEIGGWQLDRQAFVTSADNYTEAAAAFESKIATQVVNSTKKLNFDYPLFTSDYGLYWFDYAAGYDTVFTEFGWNSSQQLDIALCRGAATAHDQNWGVIIDWTYTTPPYIESASQLYDDLVLAYNNGAKYIVILDSNANYTQGILSNQHFEALQRFWQYTQNNKPAVTSVSNRVAYVLPEGFGYGFRGPKDTIWGLWGADAQATGLYQNATALLGTYGSKLDIIYADGSNTTAFDGYSKVIT